jgi:hypothetical protein
LRPSGFVQSTGFPDAAVSAIASSWRKFGNPTMTTSVSGCSMAACMSVVDSGIPQRSLNARPRSSLRE